MVRFVRCRAGTRPRCAAALVAAKTCCFVLRCFALFGVVLCARCYSAPHSYVRSSRTPLPLLPLLLPRVDLLRRAKLREVLTCNATHSLAWDEAQDGALWRDVVKFNAWLWGSYYLDSAELRRLTIGRFVHELLALLSPPLSGTLGEGLAALDGGC